MRLSVVGWERNRGETEVANLNLMSATEEQPRRSASRVFLKKEGSHDDEFEGVTVHFKASISLNSDYAAMLKIDRREIARLFLLQYKDASLEELLSVFEDIKRVGYVGSNGAISELPISVRASNALQNAGVETVGSLIKMSADELLALPHFDRKSLGQIREALEFLGLRLRN